MTLKNQIIAQLIDYIDVFHNSALSIFKPDMAKTTAVHVLSKGVHALFQHIQFSPDLMPDDLTDTEINSE